MKWITATHLKGWAQRRDSQGTLPLLVRKLIRATTQSIDQISFPSGDSIAIGGWDGILEVSEDTEFLPFGISLWEFGTNRDIKGKADDDYEKRKTSPLGFDPKKSTYIFVTPRVWSNKDEWIKLRKAENFWQDVRVYDADDLESWLDTAPTVAAWLASKYLAIYPSEGIQATDQFWEFWSSGSRFNMPKDLLLSGRKKEAMALLDQSQAPGIVAIEASSREEATAFIASVFLNSESRSEDFFSRSIVVDNLDAFHALMVLDHPMYLIVRFEDDSVINLAVTQGHTVLIPLGIDTPGKWPQKIVLPALERSAFIKSLTSENRMTESQAEELSRQSARNIAVLRRQLEFKRANSPWANPATARELLPALLAGRWNGDVPGDKNMVVLLSGEPYDQYIAKLKKWTFSPDAPIVQIGSSWRLTAPLDAWTQLARNLNRADFETLGKAYLEVMGIVHPKFELDPHERHRASWYGKHSLHSSWLREGLNQSMILISVYGESLGLDLPANATNWVNHFIHTLLESTDPNHWKSLDNELPLIAEAAPSVFTESIKKHLQLEPSAVLGLFEEDMGFLDAHPYHTGLLWALESLAWLPDFLSRSAALLATLAAKDPGGRLSNRPANSLNDIFKVWFPNTLADLNARIAALKHLSEKEPEVGMQLLIRLLPSAHNNAQHTHKPRWRLSEAQSWSPPDYPEIFKTHSEVIHLIMEFYQESEQVLVSLLEKADKLQATERRVLLDFISAKAAQMSQPKLLLWQQVRKELSEHRSRPSARWALPEEELAAYQALYDSLEPEDELEKMLWLFKEHWPAFPQGFDPRAPYADREMIMLDTRIAALKAIYDAGAIEAVIALIPKIPAEHSWILGDTLAHLAGEPSQTMQVVSQLKGEAGYHAFAKAYVRRKTILEGSAWAISLYQQIKEQGFSPEQLAEILNQAALGQSLWDFLETTGAAIQAHYWKILQPHFYNLSQQEKQYGLSKLMEVRRYYSAIDQAAHYPEDLDAGFIVSILQSALQNKSSEVHFPDTYEIQRLMEELEKKGFDDQAILVQLEWGYLPILASYGDNRTPKLELELARSPDFFVQVMQIIYQAEEQGTVAEATEQEETTAINTEAVQDEAKALEWNEQLGFRAYDLLSKWKTIPGTDQNGNIDEAVLNKWIDEAREKAGAKGLLDAAESYISGVLASYPEDGEHWPPAPIARIIQRIDTKPMRSGFYDSLYNKRGSSVRSPEEGGVRERQLAGYFAKLAAAHAADFPAVAEIFDQLRLTYVAEGKQEDIWAEKRRLEY